MRVFYKKGLTILGVFTLMSVFEGKAEKKDPPLHISAANGVKIFDEKNYMEAHQQVSVAQGDKTLYGDYARINYEKVGSRRNVLDVVMKTNVLAVVPKATIYADEGHFNMPKDEVIFTGKGLRLLGQSGDVFAKKSLSYKPEAKMAKAVGKAEMHSHTSPHKLYGEEIRLYFGESPQHKGGSALGGKSEKAQGKKTSQPKAPGLPGEQVSLNVQRVEVDEKVRLVLPGKVASGDHAVYEAEGNKIELWGNVKVTDQNKQLAGVYAVVYKDQGQSEVYAQLPAHLRKKGVGKRGEKGDQTSPNKRVKIVLLPS